MSIEARDICDWLHAIADLITVDQVEAARKEVLDLARRVSEGVDVPPLNAKERIELLAGRELIMHQRDQLANAKGMIETLRAERPG